MIPETNHDVEISIYHDFLEDQGIIVDRTPEEQDFWHYENMPGGVGCEGGVGCIVNTVGGKFFSTMVGVDIAIGGNWNLCAMKGPVVGG